MDLHIHSIESNKYKNNDYKGPEYDVKTLKSKLLKENINLFSITDHNCINVKLYNELLKHQNDLLKNNLNFVVGCELDIRDNEIYDKVFHCLVFFDTYNIDKINRILNELVSIENEQLKKYPDLGQVFKMFTKHGIEDFILIPHFNNKSKGLINRDMHIKAVDCLKRSVFNAYEDSNNIDRIRKSFDKYTEFGHPDLPILIFSDCHDISVYPKQNKEQQNNPTFLKLLGNINHPFKSLKLAFQDAELRIGSDEINYFRKVTLPKNREYVEKIKINEEEITLSPYQNTIIGGFGSGKSFLLNLLIHGKDGFPEEPKNLKLDYGELLEKIESFEIVTSDTITRKSLSELSNVDVIQFEQHEGLFYKNIIDEDEKKFLEEKLKIVFPKLEPIEKVDFEELNNVYNELKELLDKQITDTINYEDLFSSEQYFEIVKEDNIVGEEIQQTNDVSLLLNLLDEEKESKIFNTPIYDENEQKQISDVINLIRNRNKLWNYNLKTYDKMNEFMDNEIVKFNNKQLENNQEVKANKELYNNISDYLDQLYKIIIKLREECFDIQNKLSKQQYDKYSNTSKKSTPGSYSLVSSYNVQVPYSKLTDELFIRNNIKGSLFQSLLYVSYNKLSFKGRKNNLLERLNKYFNEIFYNNFSQFKYDIQKNGSSIMKKSAGEKASMIIDIIFEIIKENVEKDKQTILIIDQPEDHLDNDNIDKGIVRKIREMKKKNKIPQIIFVSHNANISITADSENIIIARKIEEKCEYKNSGIEDPEFIEEVCTILEGGQEALRTRGMKFSVSYLKQFEKLK